MVKAQVLLQVDRSYFNVLKAQALLRVANETVASRQVVYDEIAALTKSKLKSDLDLTYDSEFGASEPVGSPGQERR